MGQFSGSFFELLDGPGTPKRNLDTFARLGGKVARQKLLELVQDVQVLFSIPRYNSMISACERCSLWEEAVNVLCMLLVSRSQVWHWHFSFSMPIASRFFYSDQ